VVDDRALVVRPQQHEVAIERDELVRGEAVDLAVRDGSTVADDAAQVSFGGEHAAHRERQSRSDEYGHRGTLRLVDRLDDVARSSPSTWRGSGSSHCTTMRSTSRAASVLSSLRPEPRAPRASKRGRSRARSVTGAT
jgi:hypothetical protein